ncbi:MAG: tetratricopeptide repeat protein [Planctomycetota bacterium]
MKSSVGMILLTAIVAGVATGATMTALRGDKPATRRDMRRAYDDSELRRQIAELRTEVAALKDTRSAMPATPPEERSEIEVEAPPTEGDAASPTEEKPKVFQPSEFIESLRGKRFDVTMSNRLITALSMDTSKIAPTVKALQAAIKADPTNAELYAALGAAHVSKLASGQAQGPAAGPVFMQAIGAYKKAIELDEDHWDARFNMAFTTSMAPEFFGLRPASIKQFEDVLQRQESMDPRPEFATTYMRLGTLYKDAGNADKAKALWKKGLELYPDDRRLREAVGVAEKK